MMKITNNTYRQRGLAAVESVFVLPVFVFLMLVTLDFGRIMHESITTTNAAWAAAGYGSQNPALAVDYAGMKASALLDAGNLHVNENNIEPVAITARRVCRCVGGGSEVFCQSNGCSGALEVYVEVTATRNFHTLVPYPYIPNYTQISRKATFRVQ